MVSEKFVDLMLRVLHRNGAVGHSLAASEGLRPYFALKRTMNNEKVHNEITAKRNFSTTPKVNASGTDGYGQAKSVTAAALNPTQNLTAFANNKSAASSRPQVVNKHTQKVVSNLVKKFKRYLASFTSHEGESEGSTAVKPYSSIPGPRGLPLLGSALNYTALGKFSPKEYHKALEHNHNKYGKIFHERILRDDFVYISDPNDIRLLVQNEGASPCRPHLEAIFESRTQEGLPVGITSMQGEEWLRNRNSINPAISLPKIVKKFRSAQREIANDLVKCIRQKRDAVTGEVQDFDHVLNSWALESIAVLLLDSRLGLLNLSKPNPAAERLRVCMDIFFDYGARLTFGMPTWKLWNTRDWKIFRHAQREEFKYAGYFVEKKLKELGEQKAKDRAQTSGCPIHQHQPNSKQKSSTCLLDHVINNSELPKQEAVTVCLELLAGGIDTTASAAVFTLFHLAVNHDHQEHLRSLLKQEEAETSANEYDKDKSEFSKYLKACVWESMRFNPLTYANVRTTEKDLIFSGYFVPAGTTVRFTSHLMNLKKDEYYADADKFMPERWLDRNSPYRSKKQFTFTPFGHGARQCPGRRVAEQELDLLFREILPCFRIGYKYGTMENKVRLFNRPDKPAQFSFEPIT